MIVNFLILILTMILNVFVFLLPSWNLWPVALTNGLAYFSGLLASMNFLMPVDTLFDIIRTMTNFFMVYFGIKILMMIFNFLRGTGKGIDI